MDKEEIKSILKDVVSNFIKDEYDSAKENFHTALAAKAREKLNPQPVETDDEIAARIAAEEAAAAAEPE
jgi:hypothetical protein